jgi:hypothetical protein
MLDDSDAEFRPRVRWVFWIPIAIFVVGMVTAYFITERRKERRLRTQLLSEHALLTESLAPPYRELRGKIERLIVSAAGPWQGTYTAPGFTMQQLAREPVLYGRVRLNEVHNAREAAASIQHRYPDQVAACMGLEIEWVHQVYFRGDFLMPDYVESVRHEDGSMRLSALRQDLEFRLRRDTPDIVQWTRRRYLVLSVDEAALSIDGPTRVYVWDLRNEQILLRARGDSSDSMLIPVRIAGIPGGGAPIPHASDRLTLTQHDCAVANIAREQLGVEVLSLHNAPALGHEDGTDAGASGGDGSAPEAGAASTSADPASAGDARH